MAGSMSYPANEMPPMWQPYYMLHAAKQRVAVHKLHDFIQA